MCSSFKEKTSFFIYANSCALSAVKYFAAYILLMLLFGVYTSRVFIKYFRRGQCLGGLGNCYRMDSRRALGSRVDLSLKKRSAGSVFCGFYGHSCNSSSGNDDVKGDIGGEIAYSFNILSAG